MQAKGAFHFIRNHVKGISPKKKINFFRQMGILTGAGITILKALKMMYKSSRGNIKPMLRDAIDLIEQGNDFSKIGEYYTVFFDKTSVAMIKAGEQSGNLPTVFRQIFTNLEKKNKFKNRIIGAMMMPAFTFIFAIGVVFFMAIKVIPEFAKFLSSMGTDLPPLTQMVLKSSNFLLTYWQDIFIYTGVCIGAIVTIYVLVKPVRYVLDYILMHMPLMGPIALLGNLATFSNSMAKLIGSGVSLVESMKISKEGVTLLPFKKVVDDAGIVVTAGGTLSDPFNRARFIPIIYGDLLQAGEESGSLDETLAQLTIIYEEETEQKIAVLQAAIQPIMTILIGGLVGLIAASLILGMVSMWASQGG
jgi:type IV pilus assembly protein PilC